MSDAANIPPWLGTAVAGAIVATVGYVAKLLLDWVGEVRDKRGQRRARLVELLSLLRAGTATYKVQAGHRNRLRDAIDASNPQLRARLKGKGFERLFTEAYPGMTSEEKERHSIIRAITMNTIKSHNDALLKWIREDTYYKARTHGRGIGAQVAAKLADLEVHLLLWQAKYVVWIPDEAHSLVYLGDEDKHGVKFPGRLEDLVQKLLHWRWWQMAGLVALEAFGDLHAAWHRWRTRANKNMGQSTDSSA